MRAIARPVLQGPNLSTQPIFVNENIQPVEIVEKKPPEPPADGPVSPPPPFFANEKALLCFLSCPGRKVLLTLMR
jgi:hypothetical protein